MSDRAPGGAARRAPAPNGGEASIEVRQYFELADFGESPGIDRFRPLGVGE